MEAKSWQVLLAGALVQLAVAVAILGVSARSGDQIGTLAGWYLVAFVLVAAAVALVPFALMRYGRRQKLAAVLSIVVGIGVLAVAEFALETWVFPLFLFAAGALSWQEETTADAGRSDV